jgi:hypothetical protein
MTTATGLHTPVDQHEAVRTTGEKLQIIDRLTASGWDERRHGSTIVLTATIEGTGTPLSDVFGEMQPLVSYAKLEARWGSDALTSEASTGAGLVVTDSSHGDLRESFDEEELSVARRAFDGDLSAALSLQANWSAELTIDRGRLLQQALPWSRCLVLDDADALVTLLASMPWWELRVFLQPERAGPLFIALVRGGRALRVDTAGLLVCSFAYLAERDDVVVTDAADPRVQTRRDFVALPGLPDPGVLHPLYVGSDGGAERAANALRQRAAAVCWALLASDIRPASGHAELEFFGLQRQSWPLDAAGPVLSAVEHTAVFDLWHSVATSAGPDRLLAIRQVVSIYREAPWSHAADIARSADSLFVALRANAVAEAFRSQRDARALALTVARQTAEATTGLAKNAVERSLAVFAAVGGIIVARTAETLTVGQAADLRRLLCVYLLLLVPWSYLLEGRAVTMAIGALKRDLATFSELVPASEQAAILATDTVKRARSHAWVARIVVPVAYAAAALVALIVQG